MDDEVKAKMKIAVFSDAHGNMPYLIKCFEKLNEYLIDELYFLGDFVGYFGKVNEVIDAFREKKAKCIMGNHEAMMLGKITYDNTRDQIYKLLEHKQKLTSANFNFLSSLTDSLVLEQDGKKILFIHGSPDSHVSGYLYECDDFSKFSRIEYDVIFMGNTHRPYIKELYGKKFVNVGSCGMPRDFGNKPSFVIFESLSNEFEIVRVPINIENIENIYSDSHQIALNCLKR